MAINALQIWICTALALVPTKVLILRFCLSATQEEFDLPALLIDGCDGGGCQFEVIRKQHDFALIDFIPHHHAAQHPRFIEALAAAGQVDDFIGKDAAFGCREFGLDAEAGVVLEPGDMEHAALLETIQPEVIDIALKRPLRWRRAAAPDCARHGSHARYPR